MDKVGKMYTVTIPDTMDLYGMDAVANRIIRQWQQNQDFCYFESRAGHGQGSTGTISRCSGLASAQGQEKAVVRFAAELRGKCTRDNST